MHLPLLELDFLENGAFVNVEEGAEGGGDCALFKGVGLEADLDDGKCSNVFWVVGALVVVSSGFVEEGFCDDGKRGGEEPEGVREGC